MQNYISNRGVYILRIKLSMKYISLKGSVKNLLTFYYQTSSYFRNTPIANLIIFNFLAKPLNS